MTIVLGKAINFSKQHPIVTIFVILLIAYIVYRCVSFLWNLWKASREKKEEEKEKISSKKEKKKTPPQKQKKENNKQGEKENKRTKD